MFFEEYGVLSQYRQRCHCILVMQEKNTRGESLMLNLWFSKNGKEYQLTYKLLLKHQEHMGESFKDLLENPNNT